MKQFLPIFVFGIFLLILLPAQRANAQHGDPLPLPPDAWKGQVSGKVINQTSGDTVTEPVEVMLHAWDPTDQERLMVHGKAEPDGSFRFEDVDFHPSFSYSIMATYLGATYFSPPANVLKDEAVLMLDARVYDTTTDLSGITIAQLHVLFYIEEGQFGVTQFYALSNAGSRTVKDGVTLPRDRVGTLKFHLPDEAANVMFRDESGERYVLLSGGFVDMAPIPPGEMVSQIVVGYNLPYTEELAYTYLAPVTVEEAKFLVLASSGLTLQGDKVTPAGEQILPDGSKFDVYTTSRLMPGESIHIRLSGQPGGAAQNPMATTQEGRTRGLGVGAGILGLALLGAAAWEWRRRDRNDTDEATLAKI